MLDGVIEAIETWMWDLLTGMVSSNMETMYEDINTKVGKIAGEVGQTPAGWNNGVFTMIKGLSDSVMMPIAGIIIAYSFYKKVLRWRGYVTIHKICRYLSEKNISYLSDYADYLNAIENLGYDMKNAVNLFPRDFVKAHDDRTREYARIAGLLLPVRRSLRQCALAAQLCKDAFFPLGSCRVEGFCSSFDAWRFLSKTERKNAS